MLLTFNLFYFILKNDSFNKCWDTALVRLMFLLTSNLNLILQQTLCRIRMINTFDINFILVVILPIWLIS